MTEEKPNHQEQIRKLRSWIPVKEVQIREVQKMIETQELYTKQLKEDIDSGFFIKQKRKEIKEQITDTAKKLQELELEMLEKELEFGYLLKQADIVLEDLKIKLATEENALKDIQKKITMAERNYPVEVEKPKEDPNAPKTGRSFQ